MKKLLNKKIISYFLTLTIVLGFVTLPSKEVSAKVSEHIVISEAYGGGGNAGATYTHDFIELYNPTDQDISIDGWQVQYASATGVFGTTNNTSLNGIIKSKGYFLIQQGKGAAGTLALPEPDVTGQINMAGARFKVQLLDKDAKVVDYLGVDSNLFEGAGPAPVISNSTSSQRKDNNGEMSGDTNGWDTDNNSTDFYVGELTPRNSTFSLLDIKIEGIEVKEPNTLEVGETLVLEVILKPENTTEKKITFESLNPEIAQVDESGKVTGVSVGETEVIIKSLSNEEIQATCKIIVTGKTDKVGPAFNNLTPKNGSVLAEDRKPEISGSFEDESALDLESFKLFINEENITDNTIIEGNTFSYVSVNELEEGKYSIKAEIKDIHGNLGSKEWSFNVGARTKNLYYGQLHSHTNLSDGTGSIDDAYTYAENVAGVDFLAVTDHSNWFDNDSKASLADGSASEEWKLGQSTADKYNSDGEFVSIYGYEMTWSGSTGGYGHMNTFNTPGFETRTNSAMNLQAYYAALKTQPQSLSQFNHPGKTFGDFTDFAHYDAAIDAVVTLIEVGNGEGLVGSSGYFPSYEYYTRALDKGWHVAPTNGQDNHKGKWGNANTTRTVIEASELTRDSVYDAMREMRVYSTEDENLRISYEVNGNTMGSILDMTDVLEFNINIEDIDNGDTIKNISIIGDGGKVVKSIDSVNSESKNWTFTLETPESSYYYVQVEQTDNQKAVTAPVWVGEKEKVGLSSVEVNSEVILTNEKFDVEATVYNNEAVTIENVKVEYYGENSNEVIFTEIIEKIETGKTAVSKFNTSLETAGNYKFNVKVTATLNGLVKEFTGSTEVEIYNESEVSKVIIDGSHQNYYVSGDYSGKVTILTALMGSSNIKPIINKEVITDKVLEGVSLLILTDPQSTEKSAYGLTPQKYSEDEIAAIKRFVDNGGNIIISSKADYGDGIGEYGSAEQNNSILKALNSKIRFNDDQATDNVTNGGQAYRLYLNNYNTGHELFKGVDISRTYSFYSGSTLIMPEDLTNIDVLVKGHSTTFGADADNKGDNNPVTEGNMVALAVETLDNGSKIVMSGATFLSDFEMDHDEYSNYEITENIIKSLLKVEEVKTSKIADVRVDLNGDNNPDRFGETVVVEGYVTSASNAAAPGNTFFDVIYIQDETAGLTVFGVSLLNLKLGQKVRVKGKVSSYLGDAQVALDNELLDVEIIDESINLVEPKLMTTLDSMLESNEGLLVKVKGNVTRIEGQNIFVNDESGESRVYVEGYIGSSVNPGADEWKDRIKVGDHISAIGLASEDPEGHRLRVRDSAEIIIENVVDPTEPTDPTNPGQEIIDIEDLKNKDGKNEINVDGISKGLILHIKDIKSILEGKGSLNIVGKDIVIDLPFSILDKSLLKEDSEIIIEVKLSENTDILNNLKAINKVFEFNIFIKNGEELTEVHEFTKGKVSITLILEDKDLEGLNKAKLSVFYYNEEKGSYVPIKTVIKGNKVTFKTDHFSKFIIGEKSKDNNIDKPQKPNKPTKPQKPSKPEKPGKLDKKDKNDKSEKNNQNNKSDKK